MGGDNDDEEEEMMESWGGAVNTEQYVDNKYVRERLMVGRTTAYEIIKEIEEAYAPDAVIRIGSCLRVRKDIFFRWVSEQRTGGEDSRMHEGPDLRLTG